MARPGKHPHSDRYFPPIRLDQLILRVLKSVVFDGCFSLSGQCFADQKRLNCRVVCRRELVNSSMPFLLRMGRQINSIQRLGMLAVFIMLTACGANTSGLDELKRLCEKDAGLTIYKTVEADGYYDSTRKGGALWMLIPSEFTFVEYCNYEPNIASLFDEPGCWRLIKVSRETGQCNENVNKSLKRVGSDVSREYRETNCIAVEKLENPKAEYKYEVEREEWWINESTGTKMIGGPGKIINTKTGEVLGEAINYVLFPKWYGTPRSKSAIHCGSPQITGLQKNIPFAVGLIEKTLVPGTDKRTGESK